MKRLTVAAAVIVAALAGGIGQGIRAQTTQDLPWKKRVRITQADRQAAADRAKAARVKAKVLAAPLEAIVVPPGGVPDYWGSANWAYSPALRKFVDTLPGLGPTAANNLQQYIPVATADTTTYPLSDYYEICLVQYTQQMHSDLPPTTLRGYVQLETNVVQGNHYPLTYPDGSPILGANHTQLFGVDRPRYLGPLIVALKDRAVRIKFINKLPTGSGGDLFIPVDTTVMGAGAGPNGPLVNYTQNRADLHLHGGKSPWISDGTPHQWITPAGENTPYPRGDSAENVPDMPNPGDGATTYYYSNQQSARLMFYHDHASGITRLNVYAGEAAGYLITDTTEQELIGAGAPLAGLGVGTPLVIQDKTFVDASTVRITDPTWNWGTGTPDISGVRPPVTGDLWYPHVYSTAQNPYDIAGVNPFGRWHYGPWFWPPTTGITHPPVDNPYYDPILSPYPKIPGVPNPSIPGESFQDTTLVNGTAFPTLTVEPKAYRFRILSAANDRFFNLQLYKADPAVPAGCPTCVANTEVKMVPAAETSGLPEDWPTDGRAGGVPDPLTIGPPWIQIGTEGGFLPAPVVIPSRPIAWNSDPTTFNYGNVSDHSLLLAPAERADVIVDFSAYAGQTLILYNDAPAAFPAIDVRYDYYTGAPDLTDTGGHSGPQVGRGPNIRTIMQIKVVGTPAAAFNLSALEDAFESTATTQGVFAKSQNPILVGQTAYNSAYNTTFPSVFPNWGIARIQDTTLTFQTLAGPIVSDFPMKPKAIHDEMGAAFDSEYGRMSGKLGLELPHTGALTQNFVLQNYIDPPTEVITDTPDTAVPIGTLGDGTQIWKITHNGVDTHPIHFHLFDVQLINRVGWDGAIRLPDENELGWKETIRVSPLEDTIVALRATAPKLPFGIPNSTRPHAPYLPIGETAGFSSIDPLTGQPISPPVSNQFFDFGWEYVWHCHILSHEEDDMMRPVKFLVTTTVPGAPSPLTGSVVGNRISLQWTDTTLPTASLGNPANEIGYKIMRSTGGGSFVQVGTALANAASYTETVAGPAQYSYRILAYSAAGDSPPSNTLALEVSAVTVQVTVQTNPAGRSFTVDGAEYLSAHTFTWVSGASHTIATTTPQIGAGWTLYVWSSWSDAGAISHSVAPTSNGTTYTANFTTQVQPGCTGPPAAATLIAPSGGSTKTPTYTWNAVPGATWYYLWVNDISVGPALQQWYTAAQTGCASGTGTCSITPSATLAAGNHSWWIQTWNACGLGPWSQGMDFVAADLEIMPFGTTSRAPSFIWRDISIASWYLLWVNDASGTPIFTQWYTSAQANCGSGICALSAPTTLSDGGYRWWVESWSAVDGLGPWSEGMAFNVLGFKPGAPALIEPSGTSANPPPSYWWYDVGDATTYYLWVNDPSGTPIIQQLYTSAQANCDGKWCWVTNVTTLPPGDNSWWIQARNSFGDGQWSTVKRVSIR